MAYVELQISKTFPHAVVAGEKLKNTLIFLQANENILSEVQ